MHGIAFTLFGFPVHWYGIMVAAGFLASLAVLQYKRAYARMTSDQIIDLSIIVVVCGIVGARIAYVIQFFDQFRGNFWRVFRIDQGGLVFYGGFILAALVIFRYVRKHKLCMSRILDICAPAMAVGHAFGRIGCFLAGCCYGRECDTPISIVFHNSDFAPNGVPLLPTQLMSSAGCFILAAILFIYARKDRKEGTIGALYLILYSIGRAVIEFFRNDHRGAVGPLSTSQFISIFVLIIGIIIFVIKSKAESKVATVNISTEEETE